MPGGWEGSQARHKEGVDNGGPIATMILPKRLTRPLEARLIRAAEQRVQTEVGRLAALQVELQRLEARYESEIERRVGRPRGIAHATGRRPLARPTWPLASAPLSLRAVSFEDLRDLGLSINETTRILAKRHRGELTALSDLDTVPGLSRSVRTTLKRRLRD